ncbi:hypothetical protein [Paraburkholderia susongensis]|uniref:Uncharacterized protein n=1 Tax=Paraburkholderia susongensis TaxID=1515439 RepID=A0A1X7LRR5_9BURK|nr:hypothetical protein [Paraburkholderia susongensis]SMG56515.1 hypothetical protein SAMN06265784_108206 [Paraburkholderia susongensis]
MKFLLDSLQILPTESWLAFTRSVTARALEFGVRRATTPYTPEPRGLLYVAASTLSYHTSGYMSCTHEVIDALAAARVRLRAAENIVLGKELELYFDVAFKVR